MAIALYSTCHRQSACSLDVGMCAVRLVMIHGPPATHAHVYTCTRRFALGAILYSILCGGPVPYLTDADSAYCGHWPTLAAIIRSRPLVWPQEVVEVTHVAMRELVEALLCPDADDRMTLEQLVGCGGMGVAGTAGGG